MPHYNLKVNNCFQGYEKKRSSGSLNLVKPFYSSVLKIIYLNVFYLYTSFIYFNPISFQKICKIATKGSATIRKHFCTEADMFLTANSFRR